MRFLYNVSDVFQLFLLFYKSELDIFHFHIESVPDKHLCSSSVH